MVRLQTGDECPIKLLIADDDPITTKLVSKALSHYGYIISIAQDGLQAWDILNSQNSPDIAILDLQMPGFTGLELSQKHEASPRKNYIYKIMLSGTLDKNVLLSALHFGFHDALEKPIDTQLLQARVLRGVGILKEKRMVESLNEEIKKYATEMESLALERARQLAHAHRVSTLGTMSAGVAHEINNPMSFISGNIQSMKQYWKEITPVLDSYMSAENSPTTKLLFIQEEMPKTIDGIINGVTRVTHIVKKLKRFAGNQSLESTTFDVHEAICKALEIIKFDMKEVEVKLTLHDSPLIIQGSSIEIEQVLTNIFVNATHAMTQKSKKLLSITTSISNNHATVQIDDIGSGIPPEVLDQIWNPFFTTKPIGSGTGLGLSVSAGIIHDHKGTITACNREEGGASFLISLPLSMESIHTKDEVTV